METPQQNPAQPSVTGYPRLNEAELTAINEVKAMGDDIGLKIAELEADASTDKRWLAIAKTELQKGIMFLVRSIAKPTSF